MRKHTNGAPCDWCGSPMYDDENRHKNWDYNPQSTNPNSGKLQADHSKMSRDKAVELGVPVPLADRLLHGECNRQRGNGRNDHLAWINSGQPPVMDVKPGATATLAMPWPW